MFLSILYAEENPLEILEKYRSDFLMTGFNARFVYSFFAEYKDLYTNFQEEWHLYQSAAREIENKYLNKGGVFLENIDLTPVIWKIGVSSANPCLELNRSRFMLPNPINVKEKNSLSLFVCYFCVGNQKLGFTSKHAFLEFYDAVKQRYPSVIFSTESTNPTPLAAHEQSTDLNLILSKLLHSNLFPHHTSKLSKARFYEGPGNTVIKISFRDQFSLAEAQEHSRLSNKHPYLVPIYDVISDPLYIMFSMPRYMLDMFSYIQKMKKTEHTHPSFITKNIERMAKVLKFLHESGYTHRDVKPENIFLDDKGDAYLGDLGLVTPTTKEMKLACGTINYAAPEVFSATYDYRVDIYSLGCVLYFLLYKKYLFNPRFKITPNLREQIEQSILTHKHYQPWLLTLCKNMMRIDPNHRPTLDEIIKTINENTVIPN